MLGDVHGRAVIQAVELLHHVQDFDGIIAAALEIWIAKNRKFIPRFGHLFHKSIHPLTPRLPALVAEAVEDGACSGNFSKTAQSLETGLTKTKG